MACNTSTVISATRIFLIVPRLPVLPGGGTSSPGAGILGAGAVGAGAVGLGAAGAGTAGAAAAGAGARPDCVPACSPMLPFPPVAAESVAAAAGSPLVTSASGCGDMRSVSNRPATRPKPSVTSHPFTIPRVPRTLRERLEPRRDGTGPDRVSIALTSSDADIRTHHDLTTPARSGIARPGAKSDRPTTAPDCHPPDTPTTTWRAPDAAAMAHPDPSFRAAVGP